MVCLCVPVCVCVCCFLLAGMLCVVRPSYRNSDSGAVEEGEGHGPRKELFALISAQFATIYGNFEAGKGTISCKKGDTKIRSAFAAVAPAVQWCVLCVFSGSNFRSFLQPGAQIKIGADGFVSFFPLVS